MNKHTSRCVYLHCVVSAAPQVAPGVKVSLSATLPDTQSGKLLVDYVNQHIHIKSSVGLTTSPKVCDVNGTWAMQQDGCLELM